MAKIGVENTLNNVKQYLESQGHQVVDLNESNLSGCDCCVISGMDSNMMGMADVLTKAPVIDAGGMTVEQVAEAVNRNLQQ
jgi:hypothetical protein